MTLSEEFLANGIVKIQVEDSKGLLAIRALFDHGDLNAVHQNFSIEHLNEYRLKAIAKLNSMPSVKNHYYSLAKSALHELVGNELVMQRNINLSIQLPGDDSSLLPVHADSLQGDSGYEVVVWTPLCDVYDTKSMFFCDKKASDNAMKHLADFKTTVELYEHLKPHLKYQEVKYGECLIFSQNIFHGNRINETNETRWSLNCRFKSLFSPYGDKKIGEFFTPIEIRPATKLGLNYQPPT